MIINRNTYAKILLSSVITFIMASGISAKNEISPEKEKEIIKAIRTKYSSYYKKFRGLTFSQVASVKTYNSKTGKLLKDEIIHKVWKNIYNKEPELLKTTKYIVDGKNTPTSKFKQRPQAKMVLVFDEAGKKEYDLKITGTKKVSGINCYKLRLIPKNITKGHFIGTMYFSINGLKSIAIEGKPAKFEFGMKDLKSFTKFKYSGEIPVIDFSNFTVFVHVPLFFPNKKFVISVKNNNYKFIPK